MIINLKLRILLIYLLVIFQSASLAEWITITNKNGDKIPILYHSSTNETVRFLRADTGYDYDFPLASLSKESVEKIKLLRKNVSVAKSIEDLRVSLAYYYYNRKFTESEKKAFNIFKISAKNGVAVAQCMVGLMLFNGVGVISNKVESAKWIKKAAHQGNTQAESMLGYQYMYGEGVRNNDGLAAMYLERAAKKNDALSQCRLAVLLYIGSGVKQDKGRAMKLWNLAAAAGNKEAREILDRMNSTTEKYASLGGKAYCTKISEDDGDIIVLQNGAIIRVSRFFGFIGFNKEAILFKDGYTWKIWIEGKKAYRCDIIQAPTAITVSAENVFIQEILGDGSVIKLLDGRILEVDSFDVIDTSLWLSLAEGLIIDGRYLINYNEGEKVGIKIL